MRWKSSVLFLAVGTLLFNLPLASGEKAPGEADERELKAAAMPTEGPALLDYLRKLTRIAGDQDTIKGLIRQLGNDSFEAREKASADLTALGKVVKPFLQKALDDTDLEIAHRAAQCLRKIERSSETSYPGPVARLIALKKPAGAAEVLLAYLPFAENETIADEVRAALAAVAAPAGKVDPAVTAALGDKDGSKRAAAAEALCAARVQEQRAAVLALLKDADGLVKLRVALALARSEEKEAIPVLIEALGNLPPVQLWPAEYLLLQLAGDRAPPVSLGSDEASRIKCRDAWAAWWRDHGAKADLAKLKNLPPYLGCTLVILLDKGAVLELDRNQQQRWQIDGIQFPLDVQLLPGDPLLSGDRVLVAEQQGDRVTERNRKGEIVWEKKIDAPLMAQRLANGNTFIANRLLLLEVDRDGKEVFAHAPPDGEVVMRAAKLPNGEIACVAASQQLLNQRLMILDAQGKERRSFPVNVRTSGGRIDVQPNGHVLIPQMTENKVVEYDADGKLLWEVAVEQPIAAVRLPNGNTLITSMTQNRAVEVDRAGKEVWEYKTDTRVTRAFRR